MNTGSHLGLGATLSAPPPFGVTGQSCSSETVLPGGKFHLTHGYVLIEHLLCPARVLGLGSTGGRKYTPAREAGSRLAHNKVRRRFQILVSTKASEVVTFELRSEG